MWGGGPYRLKGRQRDGLSLPKDRLLRERRIPRGVRAGGPSRKQCGEQSHGLRVDSRRLALARPGDVQHARRAAVQPALDGGEVAFGGEIEHQHRPSLGPGPLDGQGRATAGSSPGHDESGIGVADVPGSALGRRLSLRFWSQSIVAEVYTLNTFFFFLLLYLCICFIENKAATGNQNGLSVHRAGYWARSH